MRKALMLGGIRSGRAPVAFSPAAAYVLAEYDFINPGTTDQLTDRSANANHGTFGNSGGSFKPAQGTAGVNFVGGVKCIRIPIAIHSTYRAFAWCGEILPTDQTQVLVLWASTNNSATFTVSANGDIAFVGPNSYQAPKVLASAQNATGRIVITGNTGSNASLYINGVEVTGYLAKGALSQEVPGTDGFWLGSYVDAAGGNFYGNMYYTIFSNREWTPYEHKTCYDYIAAKMVARGAPILSLNDPAGKYVIMDGDSLTVGSVLGHAYSCPFHVLQSLADGTVVINAGTYGTTTTAMLNGFSTRIAPLLQSLVAAGATATVVYSAGTNDPPNGISTATTILNDAAYVSAVRAIDPGIGIIMCTIIDRQDTGSPGYATWMVNYATINASRRGGFLAAPGALCDYQADAGLTTSDAPTGDYNSSDHVHLVDSGFVKEAALLVSKLVSLSIGYTAPTFPSVSRISKHLIVPIHIFGDTAGTLPATVGGIVKVLRDQLAGRARFTQSVDAKCPILRNSGSKYWLDFGSSGLGMTANIVVTADCTIGFNIAESSTGGHRCINQVAANGLFCGRRTSVGFFVGGAGVKNSPGIVDANSHVFVLKQASAANWSFCIDNTTDQSGTSANANAWGTGLSLGGNANDGYTECATMLVYGLTTYSAKLAGTDLTNLVSALGALD